jgi:serine/threonine protein kinase
MSRFNNFVSGLSDKVKKVSKKAVEAGDRAFHHKQKIRIKGREYVIERQLGEGGYSFVYLAQDSSGKYYAIKKMLIQDTDQMIDAEREISIMTSLPPHQNIVRVFDSDICRVSKGPSEAYIVMEYCPGGSLIDLLNSRIPSRLSESEIFAIFEQICEAVAHLHSQEPPIIHRDLKIENVLLGADRMYKLCDFGSAMKGAVFPSTERERSLISEDIDRRTTLAYRAPEMIDLYQDKWIDEKADVWALGCILYKLTYYKTPFEDGGKLKILNACVEFPDDRHYSKNLQSLIKLMLRADPDERPDVFEVLEKLAELRGSRYIRKIPKRHRENPNRKPTPLPTISQSPTKKNPLPSQSQPQSSVNSSQSINSRLFSLLDWEESSKLAPSSSPLIANAVVDNNNNSNFPKPTVPSANNNPWASDDFFSSPSSFVVPSTRTSNINFFADFENVQPLYSSASPTLLPNVSTSNLSTSSVQVTQSDAMSQNGERNPTVNRHRRSVSQSDAPKTMHSGNPITAVSDPTLGGTLTPLKVLLGDSSDPSIIAPTTSSPAVPSLSLMSHSRSTETSSFLRQRQNNLLAPYQTHRRASSESSLAFGNNPALEHAQLPESRLESLIKKATSEKSQLPNRKIFRKLIVETWKKTFEAHKFFQYLEKRPIKSDMNVCFKTLALIHRLLLEGSPQIFNEIIQRESFFVELNSIWKRVNTDLAFVILRYLALLMARLRFARSAPEYEGSFALDCYAKTLREQQQKLRIGDANSPIRRQVVIEMLDIQQLAMAMVQQMLEVELEPLTGELVWCCAIAVLNDLVASYLVIQYCLAKLTATGNDFGEQLTKYKLQYKQFRPLLNYSKERLLKLGIVVEIPELPQEAPEITKDLIVTLPKSVNLDMWYSNNEPIQRVPQLVVYDRNESEDPDVLKLYKVLTSSTQPQQFLFDPLSSFANLRVSSMTSALPSQQQQQQQQQQQRQQQQQQMIDMTMWLQPQQEQKNSQANVFSSHGTSPSKYSDPSLLIEPPPSQSRSRVRRQHECNIVLSPRQTKRGTGNSTT